MLCARDNEINSAHDLSNEYFDFLNIFGHFLFGLLNNFLWEVKSF